MTRGIGGRDYGGRLHGGSDGGVEFALLPGSSSSVHLMRGEIVQQIVGHPHQKKLRQSPYEDLPHPRRHFVSARLPVMDVQYNDRYYYREADEDHGEQQVFA